MNDESTMIQMSTVSNFGFSGASLDDLGATEYTLGSIVWDGSGSVDPFADEMIQALKKILESCANNPRAENMMLRLVQFSDTVKEEHGFRPVSEIKQSEYDSLSLIGRSTALYDAVLSSIEATDQYAEMLANQDFSANAVLFVITDGCDNRRTSKPADIKRAIQNARRNENLESIAVILIQVGTTDSFVQQELDKFKREADLDKFIDLSELFTKSDPAKALAKLADWVSRSVSSTSQALQNGSSTAQSSLLTF